MQRRPYTQRQRDAAARLGQDSVYTPEFVAGGREWHAWFDGDREPAAAPTAGELTLRVSGGGTVSAAYAPPAGFNSRGAAINLALLGMDVVSDVRGGENGGRRLQHDFVVLDFQSQPLKQESGAGGLQSGPVNLRSATGDAPRAIVAWITRADGSLAQVAGGWLDGR
ncbi:MAG: DUF1223 domain-containing protein [Verrucomicrobiota bacterium]